jgi:hypothetical protein
MHVITFRTYIWFYTYLGPGPEAPLTDQSNDIQAKLAMGQRPASFFLWPIRDAIARAFWLHTASHYDPQRPQPIQARHDAMAMIAHPQCLPAEVAVLFQRRHGFLLRRFQR